MLNLLVAFFLKISETLKAHISGTDMLANKKLSKISMHMHFKLSQL